MAAPDEGRTHAEGGEVLARLSDEMVRAQKRFFGKGPTQARSYIVDDLLFIVMRGSLTTGELTMIEFGQGDAVRDFRQRFENEMAGRLTSMVEEVTGRKVVTYQSQVMFNPDVVVEMFVFDDDASADMRGATAAGQTDDDTLGTSRDDDALDDPSQSGQ